MEKKIYCFPKGHCVLYTAYCAQQQTYSCCARVSLDQPAAPTIELQPVLVQRVLVASCWEAKLSCCSSGVLSTLTDTPVAAGSVQGLPNLQMVNGEQTACLGRTWHIEANRVLTWWLQKARGKGSDRSRKLGHTKPGCPQIPSYFVQLRLLQFKSYHHTDVCARIWFLAFRRNLFLSGASSSQQEPQGMPLIPILSCYGAEAAFQLLNLVMCTTHLSTDLSSDWQLPDSDSSGLMKASSIWQWKKRENNETMHRSSSSSSTSRPLQGQQGSTEDGSFTPADASSSRDEIQSNKSFVPHGNPFMVPSLDYCSFQLLFTSREAKAKVISTLMLKPCWEVNEIQSAQVFV